MTLIIKSTPRFSVMELEAQKDRGLFQVIVSPEHRLDKDLIIIRCFGDKQSPLILPSGDIFDISLKSDDVTNIGYITGLIEKTIVEGSSNILNKDWVQLDLSKNKEGEEPESVELLRLILKLSQSNGCSLWEYACFKSVDEIVCAYWDCMSEALYTTCQVRDYEAGMLCTEIKPKIFHVEFNHQLLAASTFMRFQERYESPDISIRGSFVGLDQFKSKYRDSKTGFDFYTNWPAFNIPGRIVIDSIKDVSALKERKKKSFLPREQAFVNVLRKAGAFASFSTSLNALKDMYEDKHSKETFYVIGTCRDSTSHCLGHELAHACYTMVPEYKEEVDAVLGRIPTSQQLQINKHLLSQGYCDDEKILIDETHAYILDSHTFGGALPYSDLMPLHNDICSIFVRLNGALGSKLVYGESPGDNDSD